MEIMVMNRITSVIIVTHPFPGWINLYGTIMQASDFQHAWHQLQQNTCAWGLGEIYHELGKMSYSGIAVHWLE
jgi:hypothetical protein